MCACRSPRLLEPRSARENRILQATERKLGCCKPCRLLGRSAQARISSFQANAVERLCQTDYTETRSYFRLEIRNSRHPQKSMIRQDICASEFGACECFRQRAS